MRQKENVLIFFKQHRQTILVLGISLFVLLLGFDIWQGLTAHHEVTVASMEQELLTHPEHGESFQVLKDDFTNFYQKFLQRIVTEKNAGRSEDEIEIIIAKEMKTFTVENRHYLFMASPDALKEWVTALRNAFQDLEKGYPEFCTTVFWGSTDVFLPSATPKPVQTIMENLGNKALKIMQRGKRESYAYPLASEEEILLFQEKLSELGLSDEEKAALNDPALFALYLPTEQCRLGRVFFEAFLELPEDTIGRYFAGG